MRQRENLYPVSRPNTNVINEFCERPDFEAAIQSLRNKWEIDVGTEIHIQDLDIESKSQNKLFKNKKFLNDLKNLQKKFNLGEQWTSFIEEYVFIDFFVYQQTSNFFIEKRTGKEADSVTGEPAYYLRIFPETTQEDIAKSWGDINHFIHGKKVKVKRQKLSKNSKRDKKIYQLAKLGFSVIEIQKYIRDEYRNNLDYDAIIKAESRYRKKMGIEEGNKLHLKNKVPLSNFQKIASNFPDS